MAEKYLNFTCPKCGQHILEEIMTNCIQSSAIDTITDEGHVYYDETSTDLGEVDHYQCQNCNYVLKDENDIKISLPEELVEWLNKHCKQE